MDEMDIVWPVGTTDRDPDLASRPMVFDPKGFLVAVLPGAEQAEGAATALRAAGFDERKLRIFSSQQILDDYARYAGQPSLTRRIVGALTDDEETLRLYHGHARDGCYALWVHVIDDDEAGRAIRGLADCGSLHVRHYGHRTQSDFYIQRPTPRSQLR